MNKSEYLTYLLTIYDRIGEPELAITGVNATLDAQIRAERGQVYYKVVVEQISDTVGKTGLHTFYVYDGGTPNEKAVSCEKEPVKLIPDALVINTFEQDAIQWFIDNKNSTVRKFGTNEVIPEIEMIRFRCLSLDSETGDMSEYMQVVWKENETWFQAKYNGTYNL